MWPAAVLSPDLELQLAVPTTVYHWLQAFHNLRCRGKPDRKIGATHWQEWLLADAQRNTVRGPGPAPAARALNVSVSSSVLAPRGIPLANLPFDPAPERSIRKSVPLPSGKRGHETHKMPPNCRQVLHNRGNAGAPLVAGGARRRPA